MTSQPIPAQPSHLNVIAMAIRDSATHYYNGVAVDNPQPAELAKRLKHIKILLALCDYEIKQLRSKK